MREVWNVILDRYVLEAVAKGGSQYSIIETAEMIMEEYRKALSNPYRRASGPPLVRVRDSGYGIALADYLESRNFLFLRVPSKVKRVGSADIFVTEVRECENAISVD